MAQDAGVRSIPELRQFGTNLSQAGSALTTLFQQLNDQMHRACDTWNDGKSQAFMQDFEKSRQQIENIAQQMQQFSQFVKSSCDILEQYNNLRR